jgi:hypothetical protein
VALRDLSLRLKLVLALLTVGVSAQFEAVLRHAAFPPGAIAQ